jgi:hypothetical protein
MLTTLGPSGMLSSPSSHPPIIPQDPAAPSSPASSRRSWRWNQLAAAPLGARLPEGSTSQRNQVGECHHQHMVWLVDLPLWKIMEWKSVGMMTFSICGKNKKWSKPPTGDMMEYEWNTNAIWMEYMNIRLIPSGNQTSHAGNSCLNCGLPRKNI